MSGRHFRRRLFLAAGSLLFLLTASEGSAAWPAILVEPELAAVPTQETKEETGLWLSKEQRVPILIILDPPSESQTPLALVDGKSGQPARIGWNRELPQPFQQALPLQDLAWKEVPGGGKAVVILVRSPGARALRLAISAARLTPGVQIRVFDGTGRQRSFGPFTIEELLEPGHEPFWSPVLEGDTAGLEIYLPPDLTPADLSLALPRVSHLWESPFNLQSVSALSCHIDVACHAATWGTTAASVARLVFTDSGATYTCTGTLVADSAPTTSIPYLLTARHCIGTQTVASTVTTFWFNQSSQCGGSSNNGTQLRGGASLLAAGAGPALDYALLRLNRTPPVGTTFAGWTAGSAELESGDPVVGISHPDGGPKKIAFGIIQSVNPPYPRFIDVTFTEGGKSAGSSGSGLFTPQGHYLAGVLSGGSGTCGLPPDIALYLSFEDILPLISPWLLNEALPGRLRVDSLGDTLFSGGYIGGSFSPSQWQINITNTGGRVLHYTGSAGASWISLTSLSGTLAPGETTQILVSINEKAASLSAGTYEASVVFADLESGDQSTVKVLLSVAGPMTVVPSYQYVASGVQGSLSSSPSGYVLTNPSFFPISYQVSTGQSWLTASPASGFLTAGQSVTVTLSLTPAANSLAPGTYTGKISFENLSGAGDTTRTAVLSVVPKMFSLNVQNTHPASGRVASSPTGIDCGEDCSHAFVEGTRVELTASAFPGSLFEGWSGSGCTGIGVCPVIMASDTSVTASFRSLITETGLSSGVPLTDSLTSEIWQGQWKFYYLDVPAGAMRLTVELYGLSADVDLYVRFGEKPSLAVYNCRPYVGNTFREECTFSSPSGGRWWIGVNNWHTGTISYTVKATVAGSGSIPFSDDFESGGLCSWSAAQGSGLTPACLVQIRVRAPFDSWRSGLMAPLRSGRGRVQLIEPSPWVH
ncbi:MAG TPA: trypsin-like peptidase domain-containing protein [Thermoanaerobaculia bacterium]|nr:trypsin-like peptidase domain-containing protein [Thermoanaerobaculia bacterium]